MVSGTAGVNGVVSYSRTGSSSTGGATMQAEHHKRARNYRLIVDPALKQGPTKVYSIEGHIPGVSALVAMFSPVTFECFVLLEFDD